ncbi:hypothetical protein SAMN05421643_105132 [Acinetobacter kyonggiensis]|uniref:Uncharacterized protein n=1 Tax=Acinetobacter kyonggiensis TaxID=595670 RepID=A0A1H3HZP1_9GAMM|nr:hypothetical protein [Acinetobacter kyonggiensis]SDY20946.1 hypothetical protein SAMN05421643_105132 [Acinetobacter kyonggiensis]
MKRSEIKRRPLSDIVIANLEVNVKEYRELDGSGGLYCFAQKSARGS